jgi:hypothetical protein
MYIPRIPQVPLTDVNFIVAAIISSLSDDTVKQLSSQKRRAEPDDEDSPTKRTQTAAEGEFYDNAAQTSQPT